MTGKGNEGFLIGAMILCFLVVALWMVTRSTNRDEVQPAMSTYTAQPQGTRAVYELAEAAGYTPQRYHDSEFNYPADAAMVIFDNPDFQLSVMMGSALNTTALRLWVEKGGRLLLFSSPMRGVGPELFNEIDQAEGLTTDDYSFLSMGQAQGNARHRLADPQVIAKRLSVSGGAGQPAALWSIYSPGVVYELSDPRPKLWAEVSRLEAADAFIPYVNGHVLLATSATADPVAIQRSYGAGEVIWVPRPEIAANDWIDRQDNHRIVLALVDYIRAGRPLYFDEHIHGFRRQRMTALGLLFGTRGGWLIVALCAVAILYFLGRAIPPARYKPRAVPPRRQATEMVLAQADLYRRAGAWRKVAESMVDGVKRSCMLARHEPRPMTDRELAQWLRTREPGTRGKYAVLQRYLDQTGEFGPRDLVKLARDCDQLTAGIEQSGADAFS